MKNKVNNNRVLYVLLGLYIAASMAFYLANIVGFIDSYFDMHHRPQTPLTFDADSQKITSARPEAKAAGVSVGDVLVAVNGAPYAGQAEWLDVIRKQLRPGDTLSVEVLKPNGTVQEAAFATTGRPAGDRPHIREWGTLLLLFGLPPLICLLIGYWVVAARPHDPFAWLILFILSFTETFMSVSVGWWAGFLNPYLQMWMELVQTLAPLALLLFGLYFPERWRLDKKIPWLKCPLIVGIAVGLAIELLCVYAEQYAPALNVRLRTLNHRTELIVDAIAVLCILLYWIAILDKSRSASTADARRRLQVLGAGSVIGVGAVLLFALLPAFHVDNSKPWIEIVASILSLSFPFTLAYVVVVQRAMDVRILVRMGTKYALARATISVLRTGLLIGLGVLLIHTVRAPSLTPRAAIGIAVIAGLLLLLRMRLTRNLSSWLDRKFFREAYNSEQLLAELSQRVRKFNDSAPMLEMVSKSLAQTLHIDKIAVLLRETSGFHLQHSVGLDFALAGNAVHLPLNSTTVRNLMRINTPVTLYREDPDGWLLLASAAERRLLDTLSTELLLPLSGRDQLMGLIALGPKRSEEPYTPSDLRLLESISTQTGLALEIGNLARSLASEATKRERIDREIEVAREVQERLFPQEFPVIEGVSLAGHCRPAQGVGGDYYDLFTLGDGRIGVAVGDVSGKGISAALLMASLRASLRGMTLDDPHDLAVMMERVNRLVYEASATNRYATFFFATYNTATRELVYVNAGHNAPFLVRRTGEEFQVQRLEAGGPVVGLLSFATYEEQRLVLEPGDLLLTYTDGISEAMTEEEEEWGEERMLVAAQTLPDGTAQEVLDHLFAEADRFTGKAPQFDDMTLLVMKLARK